MSIAELKSEVDRLSTDERRQLKAYLITLDRIADPAFREEMTRKIDDKDPSHWLTLEEVEKRLNP